MGSDRVGARTVALAACGAAAIGNALLLASDDYGLAVAGRLVVGLGSGAGFVAGLDLVRAGGGGSVLNGVYGGATMAGGGLALMVVPALTDATSWRAPFWSGLALALTATLPVLAVGRLPRAGHAGEGVLARRSMTSRRALVGASLIVGALASTALALAGPLWLSALAALGLGLAAGLPFAAIFDAARRLRPDAPASAAALVNTCAVLTILVGTPLAGLAFTLPGEGAVAFVVLGALFASALASLPRARL
jgi:MFS family permease